MEGEQTQTKHWPVDGKNLLTVVGAFCLLMVAGVACTSTNAGGTETFTEKQKDRLEHCEIISIVKRAIQDNLEDPDTFEWLEQSHGTPVSSSLRWIGADEDGMSAFTARVRARNNSGEPVARKWAGFIHRDSCKVVAVQEWTDPSATEPP